MTAVFSVVNAKPGIGASLCPGTSGLFLPPVSRMRTPTISGKRDNAPGDQVRGLDVAGLGGVTAFCQNVVERTRRSGRTPMSGCGGSVTACADTVHMIVLAGTG